MAKTRAYKLFHTTSLIRIFLSGHYLLSGCHGLEPNQTRGTDDLISFKLATS